MIRQLVTIQCDVYHMLSVTNITHLHIWEGVTYNKVGGGWLNWGDAFDWKKLSFLLSLLSSVSQKILSFEYMFYFPLIFTSYILRCFCFFLLRHWKVIIRFKNRNKVKKHKTTFSSCIQCYFKLNVWGTISWYLLTKILCFPQLRLFDGKISNETINGYFPTKSDSHLGGTQTSRVSLTHWWRETCLQYGNNDNTAFIPAYRVSVSRLNTFF